VVPLTRRPGHGLLRCPGCRLQLTAASGALVCGNRHSFDFAREGYVNLLRNVGRRAAAGGDAAEQLRHRAAFLGRGYFDAIAAAIARHVRQACAEPPDGGWRILDAGCGAGYHLAKLAAAIEGPTAGLGLDIARAAVRQAARRWPRLAFAVADLWAEWPVHDAAADLVISIFAPKNFPQAARVLRPGGWIAVVYPGPEHLRELNHRFGLMRQHEGKTRRYFAAMSRLIGRPTATRLSCRRLLDGAAIRDVVLMGPNSRHIGASTFDNQAGPLSVTFDMVLLFARKSGAVGGAGRAPAPPSAMRLTNGKLLR
jgi:23S rRNA (guanine745-N1)-methyltransferase